MLDKKYSKLWGRRMTYTICIMCQKKYRYTYRPRKSGLCGSCTRKLIEGKEWHFGLVKDVEKLDIEQLGDLVNI